MIPKMTCSIYLFSFIFNKFIQNQSIFFLQMHIYCLFSVDIKWIARWFTAIGQAIINGLFINQINLSNHLMRFKMQFAQPVKQLYKQSSSSMEYH